MHFIASDKGYCTRQKHVNAPLFRKCFVVCKKPKKAVLQIACVGLYKVFLNGRDITKGYLAPYISNYNDVVYYDEYDVADLLQTNNVLCVLLGNGFADAMDFDVWQFESSQFRRSPCFALTLACDGKTAITSADDFELYDSATTFDDIRCGERYDARLYRAELFKWSVETPCGARKPVCVDPPSGELRKCDVEPIVEERRFAAKSVVPSGNGYIYDFGENNAGVVCLQINGKRGQKITLDFGEVLLDGKLNKDNIVCDEVCDEYKWNYVQHDEYICADGCQTWTPSFTYHGFRYVYVTGLEPEQATTNALQYVVLHSDVKRRATFSCSDKTLNDVFDMTIRSDLSNLFYLPTDCPQREKNGWTADAALSAEQFLYNFDCGKTLAEWMVNVCKAQRADGMMPGIVPTYGWGFRWGNGPAWDCVITEIPYQLYRFYGDKSVVEQALPTVLRYFRFIRSVTNADGLVDFGLGDWCEAESEQNHEYSTPVQYTNAVTLADMANKALRMAELCGTEVAPEDVDFLLEVRQKFVQSFRTNYVVDGRVVVQTQTALALAITSGMLTDDEIKRAYNDLLGLLNARKCRFKVGVLGAKHLFEVLSSFGDTDIAVKSIVGPDYPSYGYMTANGATTLWESFFRLKQDGVMLRSNGKKVDSLNHHFWGSVVAWMYKRIGGINVVSSNEAEVVLPHTEMIKSATASYESDGKKISVAWQKNGTNGALTVNNVGFVGKIRLNGRETSLQQGELQFAF